METVKNDICPSCQKTVKEGGGFQLLTACSHIDSEDPTKVPTNEVSPAARQKVFCSEDCIFDYLGSIYREKYV